MDLSFINDNMTLEEQVKIWKEQYIKLYSKLEEERSDWRIREEKGIKLIKKYQDENIKMEETNKMGIKLVENLRKQIEQYQNNDNSVNNPHNKPDNNDNDNSDNDNDINNWKSRYLTEKRTSQYLRAECEDLQNELEHLRELSTPAPNNDIDIDNDNNDNNNNNDINKKLEDILNIVNEAWEEEVTLLIEQFNNNNNSSGNNVNGVNNDNNDYNNLKIEMKNKLSNKILLSNNNSNNYNAYDIDNNNNNNNYKILYEETIKSKLKLLTATSLEIDNLRNIICKQNIHHKKQLNKYRQYTNLFDRVARYHNLDGNQDELFQLIVDAQLQPKINTSS